MQERKFRSDTKSNKSNKTCNSSLSSFSKDSTECSIKVRNQDLNEKCRHKRFKKYRKVDYHISKFNYLFRACSKSQKIYLEDAGIQEQNRSENKRLQKGNLTNIGLDLGTNKNGVSYTTKWLTNTGQKKSQSSYDDENETGTHSSGKNGKFPFGFINDLSTIWEASNIIKSVSSFSLAHDANSFSQDRDLDQDTGDQDTGKGDTISNASTTPSLTPLPPDKKSFCDKILPNDLTRSKSWTVLSSCFSEKGKLKEVDGKIDLRSIDPLDMSVDDSC